MIPHSVMKCTLLCPAVVHSHHSLSPFSPFTGAIHCAFLYIAQVISKVVSLYQGAFVSVVRAPVATCFRLCRRQRHQPCMTQGSHLLLYLQLEYLKGVQRVGKGAVLELRLQSCIYKQCTHKLLRDIFKKVLVSVFTPSIDDTRVEYVRVRLAFDA